MRGLGALLLLVAGGAALAAGAASAQGYRVVERWNLGPAQHWDYATFDPVRQRIFIAHGDRVVVIDAKSGQPLGEVADTHGVHGIALAQDLQLGFATNGKSNTVTVFDIQTLQPRRQIAVSGDSPDAVVYDPSVNKVLVFNGRSNSVSIIDAKMGEEIATQRTVGKPEFAQSNGSGKVFFNIQSESGQMQVIDSQTDQIVSTWNLDGCARPTGLAIDPGSDRLFSVCSNQVLIVTDAKTGRHVATLPIGEQPDAAAFDASRRTIFSSNGGDGTLTVVHEDDPDHYRVVATVPTQKSARTMALDPDSGRVFLPAVVAGRLQVIVVAPQ